MNMFLHELRSIRKAFIIWNIALSGTVIIMLSMFGSISGSVDSFREILDSYPQEILKALNFSFDSLTSALGYYAYILGNIGLMLAAIQAMNLGVSLISKENRMKTSDFLLTKPVLRKSVIHAKLSAALVNILATNIILNIVSFLMIHLVKTNEISLKTFFMLNFAVLLVQLFFLTLGMLVATVSKKIKSVIAVSLGTVFGLFVLGTLGAILDIEKFRYLSPFKYINLMEVVLENQYEWTYIGISVALTLLFTIATYVIYQKKDIQTL